MQEEIAKVWFKKVYTQNSRCELNYFVYAFGLNSKKCLNLKTPLQAL